MHRVRTWARAKARGSPVALTSDPRRAAGSRPSPRAQSAPNAPAAPAQPAAPSTEPKGEDSSAGDAPRLSPRAIRAQKNVFVRFYLTLKDILFSSIIHVLLVFVPVGIAVHFTNASAGIIFAMNAIAIVPLAGLLSHATEAVASRLGDTIGALMNVTFGNAVELIIFIIALVKNEIRIVQASLLGSILANLLLILGMCFLFGGLRFREQIYNSTVTQMSACLLSLSVTSLLLPTAFHASFSNADTADTKVLQVSRGTSVVLLLVYGLYLLFQLNSHAYMYESTPRDIVEREAIPGPAAQYFHSSSSESSSSSDSDSDSSGQSTTTAKKIKRMMKRSRRDRKGSDSSDKPSSSKLADAPATSPGVVAENANANAEAESRSGPAQTRTVAESASAVTAAHDALGGSEEMPVRPEEGRRRHKRTHRRRPRDISEEGVDLGRTRSAPAEREADARQVEFSLAPDLEAQPETTRPKPFSLRALRPPIPKAIAQNVFTTPPQNPTALEHDSNAAAAAAAAAAPEDSRRLRRAASLPPQAANRSYRTPPGAVPPIVPIIVSSTSKTAAADEDLEEPEMSRTTAVILLLVSTGLVAVCAEFMVDSINEVVGDGSGISEAFIGLILLPIVGNAAEHVTAVTVAMKNKMDLAIGVALGSSIQIAIFVTPLVVILGWIMNKEMSLFFTLFETVSMFVSAFIVNFLVLDGRSNYLEGALLCSAYVIIAVAAFFYPNAEAANALGGGDGPHGNDTAEAVVGAARALVSRALTSLSGQF
ncbi:hypothetical protein VTK73DRAFT_10095 [Phialemonium thermophilum]|uniref:Sodium/calcium exchanger membrane region domain-containing protein n=1 Tax=Phialemonium thermophilum TaxID=223376 RepID=A0ABR3VYM5_9PEZI